MIPIIVKPVEDELFTAWIEVVAEQNELSVGQFYEDYFGVEHGRKRKYKSLYPMGLENACKMHQDMSFFPDLDGVLKKHTDLYVSMPMMSIGMSAKYFEAVLRSDTQKTIISRRESNQGYRTCPKCREEDRIQYHRTVIHVPHQISGVNVCWKHGCILEEVEQKDSPVVQNRDMEQRIARYAQALFQKPCVANIDQTKGAISRYLSEHDTKFIKVLTASVSAYYLDGEQMRVIDMEYRNSARLRNQYLIRLLAYLYPDVEELRKAFEKNNIISYDDTEDFEYIGKCGVLGEYRCKQCGERFHMHPKAVQVGVPCPRCKNGRTDDEQMAVYLSLYQNGEYELTEDKKMLRHKPCSSEKRIKPLFWFIDGEECQSCKLRNIEKWQQALDVDIKEYQVLEVSAMQTNGVREIIVQHKSCGNTFQIQGYDHYFRGNTELVECPYCTKRFVKSMKAKQRIGLYRQAVNGMGMTIVAYYGSRDMTVRFDNGLERNMHWETFESGAAKIPEIHIGEEMTNYQGLHCQIVRYEGNEELTVRFDDGVEVDCIYRTFKRGRVRHPE